MPTNPLHRHARQRHAVATGTLARTGRRSGAPAEPAPARARRAFRAERLRHPATPHRNAAAEPARIHSLSLAVCRPLWHGPVQRGKLRGLSGSVRRGNFHRQGSAPCRRLARAAHAPPAAGQRAQSRSARRFADALRHRDRYRVDRGRTVSRRRGGLAHSPLDARRLAVAALPAFAQALPDADHQSLEDVRQSAPLAGGADVLGPAVAHAERRRAVPGRGAGSGAGGVLARSVDGHRGLPRAAP